MSKTKLDCESYLLVEFASELDPETVKRPRRVIRSATFTAVLLALAAPTGSMGSELEHTLETHQLYEDANTSPILRLSSLRKALLERFDMEESGAGGFERDSSQQWSNWGNWSNY